MEKSTFWAIVAIAVSVVIVALGAAYQAGIAWNEITNIKAQMSVVALYHDLDKRVAVMEARSNLKNSPLESAPPSHGATSVQ